MTRVDAAGEYPRERYRHSARPHDAMAFPDHVGAPHGASHDEDDLHLWDLLDILSRFKWTGVLVFAVTVALAIGITIVTPVQYEGIVKVAVAPTDPDLEIEGPMSLLTGVNTYFQTQMEVLRSRPIYERVVRDLELESRDLVRPFPPLDITISLLRSLTGSPPPVPTLAGAIKRLQDRVKITPTPDSDVVAIAVRSSDPDLAADVANGIASAFAEATLRAKRQKSSGDRKYLTERLAITKQDLIDAENELRRFEDEKDTISLQRSLDHLANLRIEGRGELSDVQRQIKEVEAKIGPLVEQLSEARQGVAQATVEAYASLQRQLLDLRLRRTQLLKTYTPEHPEIQSVSAELAIVVEKVDAAEEALVSGKSGSVSAMDSVVGDYNARIQELEALRAREASLRQILDEYQVMLKEQLGLKSQYDFLQREVDANKTVYDLLLIRQKEAALKEEMQIPDARVIEAAEPPERPVFPSLPLSLFLGVTFGALGGVAAALFRGYMDRRVYDAELLERELGVPCVAQVARLKAGAPGLDHVSVDSPLIDPMTRLVFSGALSDPENPAQVILVASAGPNEGKTTVASYLAQALATGGERTLLVDCDLRRPSIPGRFQMPDGTLGPRAAVEGDEGTPWVPEQPENLEVLASRRAENDPVAFLASKGFAQMLMSLRKDYQRIVIDSPPVNVFPDSMVMARLADRVLLIIRSEATSLQEAAGALRHLQEARADVAGFLLNDLAAQHHSKGYAYGYAYEYAGNYAAGDSAAKS